MHQITYVKWRDACFEDADNGGPVAPGLIELDEVGWLLGETDEVVTIGLELEPDEEEIPSSKAGRRRLHIPYKGNIVEMRVMDLSRAFPKRSIR